MFQCEERGRVNEAADEDSYIDIAPTRLSYIASHPFTNTWGTALPREKGGKTLIEFVDLREAEGQRQWREALESRIEEASLFAILSMLNKPYILTFLKYAKGAISNEDLGECLHRSWKLIENISTDVNVSGRELVSMFKRAAKETLMEESEVAFLNRLPDTVTVYRGVTKVNVYRGVTKVNQTRQKAVSWTVDYETAVWFANRYRNYETESGIHEVWTVTVPKDRILASFTEDGKNNEGEVIVNLYGEKFEIRREAV